MPCVRVAVVRWIGKLCTQTGLQRDSSCCCPQGSGARRRTFLRPFADTDSGRLQWYRPLWTSLRHNSWDRAMCEALIHGWIRAFPRERDLGRRVTCGADFKARIHPLDDPLNKHQTRYAPLLSTVFGLQSAPEPLLSWCLRLDTPEFSG